MQLVRVAVQNATGHTHTHSEDEEEAAAQKQNKMTRRVRVKSNSIHPKTPPLDCLNKEKSLKRSKTFKEGDQVLVSSLKMPKNDSDSLY